MSENEHILRQFGEALDRGEGTIDLGDTVLCDNCSTDLTYDARSGGFLFGSYAIGPCCAEFRHERIRFYNEERFIKGWCPPAMSFADWVRSLRGGNNSIIVSKGRGGSLT